MPENLGVANEDTQRAFRAKVITERSVLAPLLWQLKLDLVEYTPQLLPQSTIVMHQPDHTLRLAATQIQTWT
ncbi:hypothetical protein E8E12_001172, partial [Didymella heteroderae]